MPFDKFLDFYIDGDYSALVKYEMPKYKGIKKVIANIWLKKNPNEYAQDILSLVLAGESIIGDFIDHTAGIEDITKVKHLAEIQRLEYKIDRIQAIVDSLYMNYNEALADTLKEHGIPFHVKQDTLHDDLKKVVSFSKKYLVELETIKKKYADKDDKEPEKPTRQSFEGILAIIDPKLMAKDIDGLRFTVLYRQFVEKNKANDKKKWQKSA